LHHPPPNDNAALPPVELLAAAGDTSPPTAKAVSGVADRLSRWDRVCLTIIALGLVNFLAYTLTYAALGGDAHNGHRERVVSQDGARKSVYYLRGHFIHSLSGREREVSRAVWIYSYLHSISVPLTSGAMIISMLALARPHILATMRGGLLTGQTFVTAFGTVIALITLGVTGMFLWHFVEALTAA
jgi:hypothetical protein